MWFPLLPLLVFDMNLKSYITLNHNVLGQLSHPVLIAALKMYYMSLGSEFRSGRRPDDL